MSFSVFIKDVRCFMWSDLIKAFQRLNQNIVLIIVIIVFIFLQQNPWRACETGSQKCTFECVRHHSWQQTVDIYIKEGKSLLLPLNWFFTEKICSSSLLVSASDFQRCLATLVSVGELCSGSSTFSESRDHSWVKSSTMLGPGRANRVSSPGRPQRT